MRILKPDDFRNKDLFGNDAGEEEKAELLKAVYVETEYLRRVEGDEKIVCVRSRKGVGKSALLRRAYLAAQSHDHLAVWLAPTEIAIGDKINNYNILVRNIKGKLARVAIGTLAADCGVATTGDLENALNIAEEDGFRSPDILSRVARAFQKTAGAEIAKKTSDGDSAARLLQRLSSSLDEPLTIFIDDIDRGWKPKGNENDQLTATISAIREIARDNPRISFRIAIREDVWQMINMVDEQLDKFRQYTLEIKWQPRDMSAILARRIKYFIDSNKIKFGKVDSHSDIEVISLLFDRKYRWNKETKQMHEVLAKLSRGRPRDMLQLCRGAATRTADKKNIKIDEDSVRTEYYNEFSKIKFSDLTKEFDNECPDSGTLMSAFGGKDRKWIFTTEETSKRIKSLSGRHSITIFNKQIKSDTEALAFLFRCGFLSVREELSPTEYKIITYDDAPHLVDQGFFDETFKWEVHPVFRPHLQTVRTGSFHRNFKNKKKKKR